MKEQWNFTNANPNWLIHNDKQSMFIRYTIHHFSSKQYDLYVPNDNEKRCHPLSNKWFSSDWDDTRTTLLSVQQLVHANKTILEITKAVYWWPFDYLKGPLILRGIPFQNIIMLQCSLVTDTDSEKIYDIEVGPNAKYFELEHSYTTPSCGLQLMDETDNVQSSISYCPSINSVGIS